MRILSWPPAALLDIGSGYGDFIKCAHRIAARYAGFDSTVSGVNIARNKTPVTAFHFVDTFARPVVAESAFRVELVAPARVP